MNEHCYPMTFDSVIVYCDDDTCKNGGTCDNTTDGFNCSCKEGFGGDSCELSICEWKKPCANNGRCVVKSDSEFVCVCQTCGCLTSPPLTVTCDIGESQIVMGPHMQYAIHSVVL